VDHLRQAVDYDPQDLVARFALAQVIEQEGEPGSEVEYQRQLEAILKVQPNNLFVLRERAAVAVRRGDTAAFRDTVARFRKLAPDWTPEARSRLQTLEKLAADSVTPRLVPEVMKLGNLLMAQPAYGRAKRGVDPSVGTEGEPIRRFLRLQPPPPSPSTPDLELTFRVAPLAGAAAVPGLARTPWDAVLPVWLTGEAEPAVFVANARTVRRADKDAPVLAFPGGPRNVAPEAAGVLAFACASGSKKRTARLRMPHPKASSTRPSSGAITTVPGLRTLKWTGTSTSSSPRDQGFRWCCETTGTRPSRW
jgi:hypothetical protein